MRAILSQFPFQIIFFMVMLVSLYQCQATHKKNMDTDTTNQLKPVAKSEIWLQYLKRAPASQQFAELPTDSNRFIMLDYNHISIYMKSQLEFEDSLVIRGESDSFLVYNFYKNSTYQLGLNKIDSTIILTKELQANGIPVGELEYFKRKQPAKEPFGK
jgi:hypothetical protein